MQFIRDPFAISFPFKFDRCSLAAEAALTSMSVQWTFIMLEIQYLVLMREAWYSSWSHSKRAECPQKNRSLQHLSRLRVKLDYKKTITHQKAIMDQLYRERKEMLVRH